MGVQLPCWATRHPWLQRPPTHRLRITDNPRNSPLATYDDAQGGPLPRSLSAVVGPGPTGQLMRTARRTSDSGALARIVAIAGLAAQGVPVARSACGVALTVKRRRCGRAAFGLRQCVDGLGRRKPGRHRERLRPGRGLRDRGAAPTGRWQRPVRQRQYLDGAGPSDRPRYSSDRPRYSSSAPCASARASSWRAWPLRLRARPSRRTRDSRSGARWAAKASRASASASGWHP